mmetsp:Transcript_31989/g.55141  ORF Transcript_31989/g.55141 Transcript_31989/m.55141 type:complete len:97 (+) Transcript_31989:1828-2118(+)
MAADRPASLTNLAELKTGVPAIIVGRVLRSTSESTTITDGRIEVTVSNLRPGVSGIVEVEGNPISPIFVEARRYTEFKEEEFDFDAHYNNRYSIFA